MTFKKIQSRFVRCCKATTWLTLLAYLMIGFGITNSFVLCIGEDGHVAVEMISNDCCKGPLSISNQTSHQSETERQLAATNPSSDDDHCGSCIDLPLTTGLSTVRPDSPKIPSIQGQPIVSLDPGITLCSGSLSTITLPHSFSRPSKHPTLASLSTVILLI